MVQQCKILLVIFVIFVVILILVALHFIFPSAKKNKTTAEMMCKEYMDYSYPKAPRSPAIWSGEEAEPGQLPHMALIHTPRGGFNKTMCGGTLISKDFILTAGHCANKVMRYGAKIYLGSIYTPEIEMAEEFESEKVHFYNNSKTYNELHDIALIQLDREVEFNANMRPICLNTQLNIKLQHLSAAGWGKYENASAYYSKRLRVVDLVSMQNSECKQLFPHKFNSTYYICAGYPDEHKDTCEGDSGGPLQIPIVLKNYIRSIYLQVGIVSHGVPCAIPDQTYVVGSYTKVAFYIPWIESVVWS